MNYVLYTTVDKGYEEIIDTTVVSDDDIVGFTYKLQINSGYHIEKQTTVCTKYTLDAGRYGTNRTHNVYIFKNLLNFALVAEHLGANNQRVLSGKKPINII